jgi:redox-sensitive bicupin YhaK (pirin superfamily)
VVVSPDGRDGSLTIRQDATLQLATLDNGTEALYAMEPGRHAWLQVLRGRVALNGQPLEAGDGAALSDETGLTVRADQPSEVLLFDLA